MANDNQIEIIKELAKKFSEKLMPTVETMKSEGIIGENNGEFISLGANSNAFPNGGCARSSRLFGNFLLLKEIETELILAEYQLEDDKTKRGEHTWLEYDNYIIDLTCCQFDGSQLPKFPYDCPFVSGSNLEWHSAHFIEIDRKNIHATDLNRYDKEVIDRIQRKICY